jgi:hypothetical protein
MRPYPGPSSPNSACGFSVLAPKVGINATESCAENTFKGMFIKHNTVSAEKTYANTGLIQLHSLHCRRRQCLATEYSQWCMYRFRLSCLARG